MNRLQAIILAGGMGERLSILSQRRAKPAVPFAGKYRIIDFTLSNCVNSGLYQIIVLTQYQPLSLTEHIGVGTPWRLSSPERTIRLLQPYLTREEGGDWYKGTADAVYQNLDRVHEGEVDRVLILSGDHVYKMDYAAMLDFHKNHEADVTLAVTRMPEEDLPRFGTVQADEEGLISGFQEKVKSPTSDLVSMGVYLFNTDILQEWLEDGMGNDFGRHLFPKMVKKSRMFAFAFEGYWRDIGTVESYWQSNMDVLSMSKSFLSDPDWPIYTHEIESPPTKIGDSAIVRDSLVCSGCKIEGHVEHSVISPGVQIAEGAVVRGSIIMNDTVIDRNSIIDRAIIDKEVTIEPDCLIGSGEDFTINQSNPKTLNTGLSLVGRNAVIPSGYRVGRNCIIYDYVAAEDFLNHEIASGQTVRPRRRRRRTRM